MSLKSQLQCDLFAAMKAKDEVKLATLRLLKSAIMAFEVSGKTKMEAKDEDVLRLLKKEVKQRKDSIEQFWSGGREDLAQAEEAQLKVLEIYLPEGLTEEQLEQLVRESIQEVGASNGQDLGKVIKAAMAKSSGRADGGDIKMMAQKILMSKS